MVVWLMWPSRNNVLNVPVKIKYLIFHVYLVT